MPHFAFDRAGEDRTMVVVHVKQLGVLALVWSTVASTAVAVCASGENTLTTDGCTGCGNYDLCLGFDSASDCTGSGCETSGVCTYECMAVDSTIQVLAVLIDFGSVKSGKEVASLEAGSYTEEEINSYPDFTSQWPSADNDQVMGVGTIKLAPVVTKFILSGGKNTMKYPRGKVSSVTFYDDFISASTAATDVILNNLDMRSNLDSLSTFLPSTVQTLDLTNALLETFPKLSMASLQALVLDNNYMTSVDALNAIDTISTLSLQNNDIDTFTGVFSNLSSLYLGDNNLTSVPTAIYKHTNLKTLNLTGNPLSSREFTKEQATFLSNLDQLLLSASDFKVGLECDASSQVDVHGVTVCLGNGVSSTDASATGTGADVASNAPTNSSGSTVASDTQTATPSGSSSTSVIVGVVCGLLVTVIAAILFFFYRRKRNGLGKATKTSSYGDDSISSGLVDGRPGYMTPGYGQLRTSNGVTMGIPMDEDGIAEGIPTALYDASTGMPTSTDTDPTTGVVTRNIPSTRKQKGLFSIWSDQELLSLQVRAEDIEDLTELGSGAYATVWLVRYRNSQLLASKRLRTERKQKKHTAMFVEEIKLLANFDHPNLVKLVGAAWTIENDLQALMEYMDGGDLRQYLADASTPCGWIYRKFEIAIDIIEALVYLHSFVPPLIHRDLKSKNVLLSADYTAKLSDFGTSRFRSVESTMTAGVGTGRWLAPEVIRGDTDYGSAADIYSFGALLTELDTNQIPYNNIRGKNGKKLSEMTILHQVATGKLFPSVRASCGPELRELITQCLGSNPRDRPPATFLAYELRSIQKNMAESMHKGLMRRQVYEC